MAPPLPALAPPPVPAIPLPPEPPLPALVPPVPAFAPPAPPAPPPPVGFEGGTQAPLTHTFPAAQSPLPVQPVRHRSAAASQVYAPHDAATTIKQLPPPLQVRAGDDIAPLQLAAPHTVPLA